MQNCRNCGANDYQNGKCAYCGTQTEETKFVDVAYNASRLIFGMGAEPVARAYGKAINDDQLFIAPEPQEKIC